MTLRAIALLLICQLAGESLQVATGLPVPGPVIGMLLLFAILMLRRQEAPEPLRVAAGGLLDHLSLLFVPAGVGVVLHLSRIGEEWSAIAAALIGSTLLTIGFTGLVMRLMLRLRSATKNGGDHAA